MSASAIVREYYFPQGVWKTIISYTGSPVRKLVDEFIQQEKQRTPQLNPFGTGMYNYNGITKIMYMERNERLLEFLKNLFASGKIVEILRNRGTGSYAECYIGKLVKINKKSVVVAVASNVCQSITRIKHGRKWDVIQRKFIPDRQVITRRENINLDCLASYCEINSNRTCFEQRPHKRLVVPDWIDWVNGNDSQPLIPIVDPVQVRVRVPARPVIVSSLSLVELHDIQLLVLNPLVQWQNPHSPTHAELDAIFTTLTLVQQQDPYVISFFGLFRPL